MRRASRNGGAQPRRGSNSGSSTKQLPRGRQWILQTVFRKDESWGKDWFPGKVTQWNEVTNKHHILYEKTVDWEEFDEWINLDKAPPSVLSWDGELPGEIEEGTAETAETGSAIAPESDRAPDDKKESKKPHPRKKQKLEAVTVVETTLEDKLSYIHDKLASQRDIGSQATLEEVEAFEKEHQITLPSPYREFILQVRNGGPGPPRQGLVKLGEAGSNGKQYSLQQDFPFNTDELPSPQNMYLGQRRIYTSDLFPGDTRQPGDQELEMVKKFKEGGWGGILFMGSDGDGDDHYLVVSGPDRGSVWILADDFFGPHELDFVDWYAQWLDRQPLDKPATSGLNMVLLR